MKKQQNIGLIADRDDSVNKAGNAWNWLYDRQGAVVIMPEDEVFDNDCSQIHLNMRNSIMHSPYIGDNSKCLAFELPHRDASLYATGSASVKTHLGSSSESKRMEMTINGCHVEFDKAPPHLQEYFSKNVQASLDPMKFRMMVFGGGEEVPPDCITSQKESKGALKNALWKLIQEANHKIERDTSKRLLSYNCIKLNYHQAYHVQIDLNETCEQQHSSRMPFRPNEASLNSNYDKQTRRHDETPDSENKELNIITWNIEKKENTPGEIVIKQSSSSVDNCKSHKPFDIDLDEDFDVEFKTFYKKLKQKLKDRGHNF